jgi:hemerythrin-like domain-containing protein
MATLAWTGTPCAARWMGRRERKERKERKAQKRAGAGACRQREMQAVHMEAIMSSAHPPGPKPTPDDAVALLTADHDKVRQLFQEFEAIRSAYDQYDLKSELVEQICFELTLHTLVEEELFYPALLEATGDAGLLERAGADHAAAKDLVRQLESMEPAGQEYDDSVIRLAWEIERHIGFEESTLFTQARNCGMDLAAVGQKIIDRKEEIEMDFDGRPVPGSRSTAATGPGKLSHP